MSSPISFRPAPEIYKKLKEISSKDGRSISNLINHILRTHLKLSHTKIITDKN